MIYVVPQSGQQLDPLELCKFNDANAPYFIVPRCFEIRGSR